METNFKLTFVFIQEIRLTKATSES